MLRKTYHTDCIGRSSHNCESSYVFDVQYFVNKIYYTENINMVYIKNEFVYVFEDYYFVKNADDSDYIDIFISKMSLEVSLEITIL